LKLLIFRCLSLLTVLNITACSKKETAQKQPFEVGVEILTIEPRTIPAIYSFVGFTQSSHQVEIRARVEGYLEDVAYKEGALVKAGDVLYLLDKKPFEAAVEIAKGALSREQAILWNAKKTKERLEPLFKENAASRKDLDSAISEELTAQAQVQSAKAKLQQAELDLSYTTIRSPISGLAADTYYKEGSLITPGAQGLLTTVSVLDPIYVYFSVSENERLKFNSEEAKKEIIFPSNGEFEIELMLADGTTFPHRGKVNFSSPTIDQKTGTMSIRAALPNPGNILVPGQFVRINVLGISRPNAILIPQKAVLEGKNGMFVYVVIDGKAQIRNVEAGDWYQNDWIMRSGLQKGDVVIVDGVNKVKPNTPVTTLNKMPVTVP